MTDTLSFVLRVLKCFEDGWGEGADHTALWWRTDGEYAPVTFLVQCNDLFWWATADCERITPENVHVLERAVADCLAADESLGTLHAADLFACRARGMRPQGAAYRAIEKTLWPLFDAAGPPRETDAGPFGNPRPHPFDVRLSEIDDD